MVTSMTNETTQAVFDTVERRIKRSLPPMARHGYTINYGNQLPRFIRDAHVGRVPRALTDVQRRGGRGTP